MSKTIESIEQLINIDYNNRAVDKLYTAARSLTDKPIIEVIAEKIAHIAEGSYVVLTTGSVTRTWVDPGIAETDGPIGTAVLAKKIRELTHAIPVIVTEESLTAPIAKVVRASGLSVVSLAQAQTAQDNKSKGQTSVACMIPFTDEDSKAGSEARDILDRLDPVMVISVEKAGANELGIYHNMRGFDYSPKRARVDFLVREASRRGITTIGIGDGGNEIGMGAIIDTVRRHVKYGAKCQCGCGKGIAAFTTTDILLTASVSNWGCYAICAALAIITRNAKILHNSSDELRMLNAAVESGMVDGSTGQGGTSVDSFNAETNFALIDFIALLAKRELGI